MSERTFLTLDRTSRINLDRGTLSTVDTWFTNGQRSRLCVLC